MVAQQAWPLLNFSLKSWRAAVWERDSTELLLCSPSRWLQPTVSIRSDVKWEWFAGTNSRFRAQCRSKHRGRAERIDYREQYGGSTHRTQSFHFALQMKYLTARAWPFKWEQAFVFSDVRFHLTCWMKTENRRTTPPSVRPHIPSSGFRCFIRSASSCSHYNLRDDPDPAQHLAKKEEQLCRKIERIPENTATVKHVSIWQLHMQPGGGGRVTL